MVKVREDQPILPDGNINIDAWVARLIEKGIIGENNAIATACKISQTADKYDPTNLSASWEQSSAFVTGLEMADILAGFALDEEALIAAILYRVVREGKLDINIVKVQFGDNVVQLINGVLQMAAISLSRNHQPSSVLGQSESQIENVRKMLVSLINDVRVALIKLAERTCAIRALKHASAEKKLRVAREVFDIYAPLAHRLGIGAIKWELEDLSFRYLHAKHYKKIASLLDEKRIDRQDYIDSVLNILANALEAADIKADINGRAKHIYSIWRKMTRKGISFEEVYDIHAVRILVPRVQDCYACLGIVHSYWQHIPKEFDDYIATPKENGYQSLHTAVIGPEGKVLEVQIRTENMHSDAELGVCAHWKYKGTDTKSNSKSGYESKISWLRQVLEWHEETGGDADFSNDFANEIDQDRVYVFTPEGHIVDVVAGATPIDFAYKVHTEIGHRCRGAKINGRIVPLSYTLQNGDRIEIIKASEPKPRRDWLNTNLGYVKSARAKSKIVHWFKLQARDQNIDAGKDILEKELKRLDIQDVDWQQLAERVNCKTPDDIYAAVGSGDLSAIQIVNKAQKLFGHEELPSQMHVSAPTIENTTDSIFIRGVGKLLTQIASCCKPVPGDEIGGFITQGRGVSIHRTDCSNFLQLSNTESERIIEVSWGGKENHLYPVDIKIVAYDRTGLLRDVSLVMANANVNVISVSTHSNKEEGLALMDLTIEIDSVDNLRKVLEKIQQLPNIVEVKRHRSR